MHYNVLLLQMVQCGIFYKGIGMHASKLLSPNQVYMAGKLEK